jgi:uncharacterized protein DUF3303
MAKYLVSWMVRQGGSAQQNHDDGKRLLDTFAKWQAPGDQNFLQFLSRMDGRGGYAVVETDNAASLMDAPAKFGTWLEFEITPVLDIVDGVTQLGAGAAFRESI